MTSIHQMHPNDTLKQDILPLNAQMAALKAPIDRISCRPDCPKVQYLVEPRLIHSARNHLSGSDLRTTVRGRQRASEVQSQARAGARGGKMFSRTQAVSGVRWPVSGLTMRLLSTVVLLASLVLIITCASG